MRAVLKYPGAKNRVAGLCSHMPTHNVYLEPFAGSLAVLFAKQRCHIETVLLRGSRYQNHTGGDEE